MKVLFALKNVYQKYKLNFKSRCMQNKNTKKLR